MFCIIGASVDGIFYFPLHFAFPPFSQNNATVLFVVLAPTQTPIAHRMTWKWNSQPGMTRNLSRSLWFGSYIPPILHGTHAYPTLWLTGRVWYQLIGSILYYASTCVWTCPRPEYSAAFQGLSLPWKASDTLLKACLSHCLLRALHGS